MAHERRVRVLVSGMVQGVFFRDTTRRVARDLGLTGHVRNLGDGRVEAEFQGPGDFVEQAIAYCRQGPDHAQVNDVEVTELDVAGDEPGFVVR